MISHATFHHSPHTRIDHDAIHRATLQATRLCKPGAPPGRRRRARRATPGRVEA